MHSSGTLAPRANLDLLVGAFVFGKISPDCEFWED